MPYEHKLNKFKYYYQKYYKDITKYLNRYKIAPKKRKTKVFK